MQGASKLQGLPIVEGRPVIVAPLQEVSAVMQGARTLA